MELAPIFKKSFWILASSGLIYVLGILSLTIPTVQRGALYAHNINPSKFQDVNDVESFGFLRYQVQPFNLVTPDNETLYAWHILPPHLCHESEVALLANLPSGPAVDVGKTIAFELLAKNPNARVVLNLHGNAAHIGSGFRPRIYRSLLAASTPSRPIHVITFDYRGFGLSTGSPTEDGLITDALTVINYLTSPPLSLSPSRIAIVGQSLGTAVAVGAAERFVFGPTSASGTPKLVNLASEPLAGIILFSPFTDLRTLMHSYRLLGIIPPLFSPLIGYPRLQKYFLDKVVDTWDTASRLARLTGVLPTVDADPETAKLGFDLTIVHASDDFEIPWSEGKGAWEAAIGGVNATHFGGIVEDRVSSDGAVEVKVWEKRVESGVDSSRQKLARRVRWEKFRYGGHNMVATFSIATLAVIRVFDK